MMLNAIYPMAFTFDTTHFLCCIGLVYNASGLMATLGHFSPSLDDGLELDIIIDPLKDVESLLQSSWKITSGVSSLKSS